MSRHAPATLYSWQLAPAIRFTYTPFAALLYAGTSWLPWPVLCRSMTAAGLLALTAGTFAALAGIGSAVLPRASVQWWLVPAFLRPGRTGFVAFVGNQSLRALAARTAGSVAASGGAWLALAVATAVTGLIWFAPGSWAGAPSALRRRPLARYPAPPRARSAGTDRKNPAAFCTFAPLRGICVLT